MPGTLLRYIGFGGLLIIACGGLAWYKMSDLMIVVGRELLAGTDIKLVSATLARQARLPLVIDELTLRSRTETFHINNLQISPLTPWANAWRLDLEQLQVEGLDQELNAPIVTVGEWQDELMAVLPTLPEQGHIASYRYCDNGCLTGSLHWQRQASEVLAKITVQQYGAQAELLIASDELALTVVADAAKATATDSPLPVTEALGLPLPALWILNGHVSTANSATPFFTGTINLGRLTTNLPLQHLPAGTAGSLALSQAQVEFSMAIPAATPATVADIWHAGTLALSVEAAGEWGLATGTTALSSESGLAISATHNAAGYTAYLDRALVMNLSDQDLMKGQINVDKGASCQLTDHLECTIPTLNVHGRLGAHFDYVLEVTDTRLSNSDPAGSAQGTAHITVTEATQPVLQATMAFTLMDSVLLATSQNTRAFGVPLRDLVVREDFVKGVGEAQATFDTALLGLAKLPQLTAVDSLQIRQGTITGKTQVNWDSHSAIPAITNVASTISLKNTDFNYDDYQIFGLFLDLQLAGWPVMTSSQPAQLRLQTLDIGIPITDIAASFDVSADSATQQLEARGQNLTAHLFEGEATSTAFHFESSQLSGFAQLRLKALALQQILDLGRDDFDSSGQISGSVPVQISQGNISVVAGQLNAEPPGGHIRYTPNQATRDLLMGSDKTKIVLDTLSDFQYHRLAVTLDYSATGNLTAKTALQGHNPNFEQGREIHFNLSIEENIGTLLESLRMGDTVEKKVQNGSKLPGKTKH